MKRGFKRDMEIMNQIVREAERQKDFVAVFNKKVTNWGGSAHIPIPKQYSGHPVRVIILKKEGSSE